MRTKKLLGASLLMFLACACSSNLDEVTNTFEQTSSLTRSMEQMPSFKSEAEFEHAVELLSKMGTWEEKKDWVKQNYGEFQSMQLFYDEAMEEADNLGETEAEYNSFKEKFSSLYFPMYQEDYGFYIPMKDLDAAFLVNADGNVRIGNEVVNKADINSYDELMNLDRAYYSLPSVQSRSVKSYESAIIDINVENVGSTYDSGWKTRSDGKRKLKFKTRRRIQDWRLFLHTEVCFRKKNWRGWVNYKSKTTITGSATMYFHEENIRLSSLPLSIGHSESGRSSHDFDFPIPVYHFISNNKHVYVMPRTVGNVVIDYQGMGKVNFNNWTLNPVRVVRNGLAPLKTKVLE